jgi:hypothetical protein
MENKSGEPISIPKKAKVLIIVAILFPVVLGGIFTLLQWYPATIIIEKMADENGQFSLKSAILINSGILMLVELVVVLIVLLIKKVFFKKA